MSLLKDSFFLRCSCSPAPQYIEVEGDSSLSSIGLKHGDMLHLKEKPLEQKDPPAFMQKDYQKEQSKLRDRQKGFVLPASCLPNLPVPV